VSIPANRETIVTQRADDPKKPYGDVEYADPGYQEDGKKRYPIDTEDHIRAAWNYINQEKNAGQYSADEVTKIKAKIVAAWKDKIDKDGPPSAEDRAADSEEERQEEESAAAEDEKKRTAGIPPILRQLRQRVRTYRFRGMQELGQWAWLVDCISNAGVAAALETALEGDDSEIPGKIDDVLERAVEVLVAMAQEEGSELLNNTEIGPGEALDEAGLDDDDKVIVLAGANPRVQRFRIGYLRAKAAMATKRAGKVFSADTERCLRSMLDNLQKGLDEHRSFGRTHRAGMMDAMRETRDMLDRAATQPPSDEEDDDHQPPDNEAKPSQVDKTEGGRSADFRRRQAELLQVRAA